MRIVFMGTPAFALPTLQALIDSTHEVVAVYCQPPRPAGRGQKPQPSPVQRLAEMHAIPVYYPTSLRDSEVQATFNSHAADAAIVAAYGLLLPPPILNAYRYGCINIHPSDLPRWRGAAPIQRTIMAGDADTAICIMHMDEGLDTGDVLLRKPLTIPANSDAGWLHDWLAAQSAPLLLEALQQLQAGTACPTQQSAAGITYASKISKQEAALDWQRPAHELLQQIRGLVPSPCAYFEYASE
ncbi:MAG: methionyl-tRNA formyltransferase, partial [Rickettsiales bacterium]|nr:methionyl-tRNA formyltransferase [Rickettsiales bacterium]